MKSTHPKHKLHYQLELGQQWRMWLLSLIPWSHLQHHPRPTMDSYHVSHFLHIPSMHQIPTCNRVEINIPGDPNPYLYCNNINHRLEPAILINKEASSSISYADPTSLKYSTSKQPEIKANLKDKGIKAYSL